jgi:hypothetical protein
MHGSNRPCACKFHACRGLPLPQCDLIGLLPSFRMRGPVFEAVVLALSNLTQFREYLDGLKGNCGWHYDRHDKVYHTESKTCLYPFLKLEREAGGSILISVCDTAGIQGSRQAFRLHIHIVCICTEYAGLEGSHLLRAWNLIGSPFCIFPVRESKQKRYEPILRRVNMFRIGRKARYVLYHIFVIRD